MKKSVMLYILIIVLMFLFIPNVMAAEELHFCNQDSLKSFIFIGNIISVIKIGVPLIIIVFGMIDFGRAVVSSDDKATSSAAKSLIQRLIAGIVIFLIPSFFLGTMNILFKEEMDSYDNLSCVKCILHVSECDFDSMVNELPEK